MHKLEKSAAAFAAAKNLMPGGVNSPVRSYRSIGGNPPFIARAEGSHIYDIDDKSYIDYVGSWGPMAVGHAHPQVVAALNKAAALGTSYGAPTLSENELAKRVCRIYPSIELVRMVNSGTEATMSALRLARGFTGREKIVKFIGCYHGHSDSLLVKAGSGMATYGVPDSPGVTKGTAADTLTLPYNDEAAFVQLMQEQGKDIAAVIVEPVAGNMGLVLPQPGFLSALRAKTAEYGSLLIFDEVMCGFRVSRGGAQEAYGIKPDLTCLGKIIGGGLPVAAYGGRRDIMSFVSPAGPVYQAGTLSGNPLAMAAGCATLDIIASDNDFYDRLGKNTASLVHGVKDAAARYGVQLQAHQAGSMFGFFFNTQEVVDYSSAAGSDQEAFRIWFLSMLEQGIYLAPSQFETIFMSAAHTAEDIEKTLAAAEAAMQKVAALR